MTRAALPAVFLLCGLFLLGSVRRQEAIPTRQPLESLPMQIGSFSGVDRPMNEVEQTAGGTSAFVLRSYSGADARLFSLYVGYYASQAQGRTIHSPKNCLPGDGWETMSAGPVAIGTASAGRTVNRVLLTKEGRGALVYYWYQGRGRVVANEYTVKWNLLRDAVWSRRTEEALARIVVMLDEPVSVTTDSALARADSMAVGAAGVLIPALDNVLPRRPGAREVVATEVWPSGFRQ